MNLRMALCKSSTVVVLGDDGLHCCRIIFEFFCAMATNMILIDQLYETDATILRSDAMT